MSRDIQLRCQVAYSTFSRRLCTKLNVMLNELFWYEEQYAWSEFRGEFKRRPNTTYANNILEDIQECYWLSKSSSGRYYGLVKLQHGYGYFKAVSGYYGLVEGSIVLFTAPTREILIQHAMSNHSYQKYIKKTQPN
jgi:hypothetical protein